MTSCALTGPGRRSRPRTRTGTWPSSTRRTDSRSSVDGKGLINKKSERYKAAEAVARRSHRLILMTATPHSGRDYSLWALLRLLDLDA